MGLSPNELEQFNAVGIYLSAYDELGHLQPANEEPLVVAP